MRIIICTKFMAAIDLTLTIMISHAIDHDIISLNCNVKLVH